MASAHAKFTGQVGLCFATSGPGAIRLLNGLYDAKMDHVPVVARVGQQARSAIGASNAVFKAVQQPAREYWIGFSTIKVILGNMMLPGFLDWYLARTCIKGQQIGRPVGRDRPDNLNQPVHGIHRTRRSFSSEAVDWAAVAPGSLLRLAHYAAALLGSTALCLLLLSNRSHTDQRAIRR